MRHQPLTRAQQFHKAYMDMAVIVATLSYCNKRQVGAVIVKDGNILGYGFNGAVSGMPNVCEDDETIAGKDVHAEMNAVLKSGGSACKGADAYVTVYPCEPCARMMAQAGIKRVFYQEDHPKNMGQVEYYNMMSFKI